VLSGDFVVRTEIFQPKAAPAADALLAAPPAASPAARRGRGGGAPAAEPVTANLCCASAVTIGQRSAMEDTHHMEVDFHRLVPEGPAASERLFYCAVFDGHGGVEAAEFCRNNLHLQVAKEVARAHGDVFAALRRGVLSVEQSFVELALEKRWESGAVVAACVLRGSDLFVAHLGDTRVVLSRRGTAVLLTGDHVASNFEEKMRVEREGGVIAYGAVDGRLSVTRAIGDLVLETGRKVAGLSADPEVHQHCLEEGDEFIIVASDGLWESMDAHKAVMLARMSLQDDNDVAKASKDLVLSAARSEDNITVVIVGFQKYDAESREFRVVPDNGRGRRGAMVGVARRRDPSPAPAPAPPPDNRPRPRLTREGMSKLKAFLSDAKRSEKGQ
jgi:protein phosphatase 2C family protein 2/3